MIFLYCDYHNKFYVSSFKPYVRGVKELYMYCNEIWYSDTFGTGYVTVNEDVSKRLTFHLLSASTEYY